MTDWRVCGELVRERGRQFLSEYARHELRINSGDVFYILDVPVVWLAAGFVDPFDPLRFDDRQWHRAHPLPEDYADPINGRPRNNASRAAATIAGYFYDAWRIENQKREISDYGHRREMKDFAAQAVVEDIFALQFAVPKLAWMFGVEDVTAFTEIVRDLMEKPKSRRALADYATVDFLATPLGPLQNLPPKPHPQIVRFWRTKPVRRHITNSHANPRKGVCERCKTSDCFPTIRSASVTASVR